MLGNSFSKKVRFDVDKNITYHYKGGHYAPGAKKISHTRRANPSPVKITEVDENAAFPVSSLSEQEIQFAIEYLETQHETYKGFEVIKCIYVGESAFQLTFFDDVTRASYKSTLCEDELKSYANQQLRREKFNSFKPL